MDRVLASGARDESSTLSGGTIVGVINISGRGPAVGRLVWDQEVASSILAAPTIRTMLGKMNLSNRYGNFNGSRG